LANGDAYYEQIAATFMLFGDPATTLKVPLPYRPTGLKAVGKSAKVRLSWNAATDCDGHPVAGYNVYWATTAAGPFSRINTQLVTTTRYVDADSGQGIAGAGGSASSGYYVVTAVDSGGTESVNSLAVKSSAAASTSGGSAVTGCFITTAQHASKPL
jgi:hypothetical protein